MAWIRRPVCCLLLLFLAACGAAAAPPTTLPPSPLHTAVPPTAVLPSPLPAGLTADQAAALSSLEKLDDYPLYTMRYAGTYDALPPPPAAVAPAGAAPWGCSLFAALGSPGGMVYGRNFDWDDSPALLLSLDPPDGYASVSMVDIAYLGFAGEGAGRLLDLPLEERLPLLYAALIPFDGMNEAGLAVGMAAVPGSPMPGGPGKATVDSLRVIREMLDRAATVDQALAVLGSYNIDWGSGPPLHYLIADRSGRAVLVEFYQGEMVTFPNAGPWHQATNFLHAAAGTALDGRCWRYDRLAGRLGGAQGRLTAEEAMALLEEVSQPGTQWSVVYGMDSGQVMVSMGRQYERVYNLPARR